MKIASKTLVAFAVALASVLVVGVAGILQMRSIGKELDTAFNDTLPSLSILQNAKAEAVKVNAAMIKFVLTTDLSSKDSYEAEMKAADANVTKFLKTYQEKYLSDEQDKKLLSVSLATFAGYQQSLKEAIEVSNSGDLAAAEKLMKNVLAPKAKQLEDNLEAQVSHSNALGLQNADSAKKAEVIGRQVIIWGALAGLILSAWMGFKLYLTIRSGLNTLYQTVHEVSLTLDFTRRAKVTTEDEVGKTIHGLNELLDRMQQNLQVLLASSQEVANSANQMTANAQQLAQASDTQSDATENVAATTEQMAVSIQLVADQSHQSQGLAKTSGQLAIAGAQIIGSTIDDIRRISATVKNSDETVKLLDQQSNQIGAVLAVIKEVADQTNLLALNAAIEAARAGEQGRGFAVVADEVRKLAERTALSTQEIAGTINQMRQLSNSARQQMELTLEEVNASVKRADEAGGAIEKIGEAAENTASNVEEIALAIHEQSSATSNIAVQIERITQMTEEASASAVAALATANRLDQLASEQMNILQKYKL